MKKFMSLFLVFCICLGFSTMSFAESKSDVVDGAAYQYAENLLSDLGIYEGVEAYTAADGFVKKDVFAILITRLMNIEAVTEGSNFGLLDLKADDFAANEIFTLMRMGIFDVPSDGYFKPDKFITYKEAAKALVQVLGYDVAVTEKNYDGYYAQAHRLGIMKNVSLSKDERLQVKQLTMMLYNTLFIDSMGAVFTGAGQEFSVAKGHTLLSDTFNLVKIDGVVTANSITNLSFEAELPVGKVMIGGIVYHAGQTNAEDLLGYKVRAYYDKDTETLISVDSTVHTTEYKLDVENLTYQSLTYLYEVNDRQVKANISSQADIIYNHEAMVFDENLMVPNEGEVLLLDHDSDKIYDTVIITSSEIRVVQEYSNAQSTITFKYTGDYNSQYTGTELNKRIDYDIDFATFEDRKVKVLKADGTPGKLTSLSEWSVVDVRESLSGNYIEVYLLNEKVTGNVEEMETDANGEILLTISGKQYRISHYYPNFGMNEILLGTSGIFYLDSYGKIAGVNVQENLWYFGYLMQPAYLNTKGFENAYMFRIFSEEGNGSVKELTASKKLNIDNVSCGSNGKNNSGTDVVSGKLMTEQLIRYKVNIEGKLTHIDTLDTAAGEFGLRVDASSSNRKYRNNHFAGDINVDNATRVFVLPYVDGTTPSNSDDPTDGTLYQCTNAASLVADRYYVVTSYITDPESLIADAIIYRRSKSVSALNAVMIDSITTVYDSQRDEVLEQITGYAGATTYKYLATPGYCTTHDIAKGDLVSFATAPDGLVESVLKIYDMGSHAVLSGGGTFAGANEVLVMPGYAYNKQSGILQVSGSTNSLVSSKKIPVGSTAVVVYDSNSANSISVGTLKDIEDYKHYANADRVVLIMNYMLLKTVFVYK